MSRWFEPPMKLQDAVNTLHRAINERYPNSINRSWGNTPTPSAKTTSNLNVYDATVRSSFWGLYDRIINLLFNALVLKDDLGKWSAAFPYRQREIEDVISEILSSNGISPNDFLGVKERPGHLANSKFLNACYVLINHVRFSNSYIEILWNSTNILHTTDNVDVEKHYGFIPRLVYYDGVNYSEKFKSGTLGIYTYTEGAITGAWDLKLQMVGLKDYFGSDGVEIIAEYEQTFSFNSEQIANAPSLLGNHVTFEKDKLYYETTSGHLNGYGYGDISHESTQVFFTESSFPKLQYYDPPQ